MGRVEGELVCSTAGSAGSCVGVGVGGGVGVGVCAVCGEGEDCVHITEA